MNRLIGPTMDQLPLYHSLSQEKQELLLSHLRMVMVANERVNLTRISDMEEGLLLHVEDSLTALQEMEKAPDGLYADMGSGAGFPGIPLAIATGRKTTLIDSRKKKMDEVAAIVEEMGLSELIETYAGRAELLARSKSGEFSVITARALSQLSVLLELASPLLKNRGQWICYKANLDDEELRHAESVGKRTAMKLVSDRSFMLGSEYKRRIVVFEKHGKPSIKLPRLEGQAQKNPL